MIILIPFPPLQQMYFYVSPRLISPPPSSPLLQEHSEEEPTTPRVVQTSHNPKYQLLLNSEMKTNGVSGRDADGPGGGGLMGENGPRLARWETNRLGTNNYRGSLESLASRDWDTMSDRVSEVDHGLCRLCGCSESHTESAEIRHILY